MISPQVEDREGDVSRNSDAHELDLSNSISNSSHQEERFREDPSAPQSAVEGNAADEDQHEDPTVGHDEIPMARPSMTLQETKWWAMSFEELYKHAQSKNFGKSEKESRKSGRVKIIRWLCEKEEIIPYAAPSVASLETTQTIARPTVRPTGAISHPEAILRTTDPALQRFIDEAEKKYQTWPGAQLRELAMNRSYQLLKDSSGKLPSKSSSAIANRLAAWDVLKSTREKSWWLGDGIDLVNRAKAMGYQGSSKKYDVIVWLRSTPEDAEAEAIQIAKPTPNKKSRKRKTEEAPLPVSKRPAKGSRRPYGWHTLKHV
ncbi:hypothetical protein D0Z07_2672 [Hyphodiscus hymeniophilus]|uniref:Uncharacterized protein n=1 Tax=Hyphodiscus hymeniophilus TaxID=353542 RepID=A0A9P6VNM3_9HELO|nr:hypothetical protein D0Z07_2672 [Hyphodiscus hymeniophilus]